ncbi:endonuclease MutS2 [Sulfurospirillum barnesii]|uniref:Endonuclease MutS2 n=1 Tax=Sulfurospirillum barnesii (strain ATCC 700032 / DSM 10660 / SES-3) TaxID=760154 RepID=I3XV84_SULBS|nr:endonuclease MutS2 [Sulfurospirillum barnesii]AFL67858.1 mismatch repair ATPase (MutS family) [Sulfurospirillum barnesii SES-3]
MEKLFSKLDLVDYASSFKHFLAREKPLFMEGDANLHYKLIHELLMRDRLKPLPEVPNLDVALMHLSKMGVLRLSEIFAFVQMIAYFLYLKSILREQSLGEWMERILIPEELQRICDYFDDKGELKASVDEQFAHIAKSLKMVKEEMNSTLRRLISTEKIALYLADKQIHYINNQEALLVRGGFNHVLKGNVIGRSSSGFFYVVPEALSKLVSRESELLDKKEELVYTYAKQISSLFSKQLKFLSFANKEFDRFDAYYARVAYAREKDMDFVLPSKGNALKLENFAHPALLHPKPISIDFSKQVLMITGVNAGGKTMLLKSILSAAILSKYLLPMRIDAKHSTIGSFKEVFAILDDPQNVKNDISTFAGRMSEFSKLFGKKATLVGVDEIELGTDADEAANLFKVMIEKLIDKEMKIVITTHHKRLASLLATHPEVELLAAIYDEKTERPTYSFLKGTIGKSYAFETALRYGIPQTLVAEARVLYGEDKEKLNDLIQKNIDLELKMRQTSEELETKLHEVEKLKLSLKDEKERVKDEFELAYSKMAKEFQEAIGEAKKAIKSTDTKESHRLLNKANQLHQETKKVIPEHKPEPLVVGDRIKYGSSKGVIKSIKKEEAMIECDGISLRVPLSKLKRSGNPPKAQRAGVSISKETPSASMILDLHGLRADEAIERLDKFLSDALMSGFDEVLVYHGIGTGKLAYAVRTFLSSYPALVSYGDAPINMGGFGATLIKL